MTKATEVPDEGAGTAKATNSPSPAGNNPFTGSSDAPSSGVSDVDYYNEPTYEEIAEKDRMWQKYHRGNW